MRKQILLALLGVGCFIAAMGVTKFFQISRAIAQNASFAPPPEAVTSTVAAEQTWKKTLNAIGTISPFQGVTISAEESGKVAKVNFESGQQVKQGDPLIELDSSVEEANLASAVAKLDLARRNFTRAQTLRPQNVISDDALDTSRSQFAQAEADVQSMRAVIGRRKITAPFTGRTGIRMVNVGQYVEKGNAMIPLYALDPIYLDFSVPQQVLSRIGVGQDVDFTVDAFGDTKFTGKVSAINPQVDVNTRNVEVRATVTNTDEKLHPGMFAKVSLSLPEQNTFIVLPSTSISYAPYGDTVYVIESMKDPKGKEYRGVRQQIVRIGERRGDLVSILSGLKPGDEIVTSGVFKLRPGSAVSVNNSFKPGDSTTPTPADT